MKTVPRAAAFAILALAPALAAERPADIVDVRTIIPDIQLDMRYTTSHNFVGRPIAGYLAAKCLLTKRAAQALKRVHDELRKQGLTLKVYDCYRPQTAVDDFVAWGKDLADQEMKAEFYPSVDKRNLFRDDYIAAKSSHSRGSTLDLTIVPVRVPPQPEYEPGSSLKSCENQKCARFSDNSIDMGTGYDCFSLRAHTAYPGIGAEQGTNRAQLKSAMERYGFVNLPEEWWHYTLLDEPYPGTYFDFPVE